MEPILVLMAVDGEGGGFGYLTNAPTPSGPAAEQPVDGARLAALRSWKALPGKTRREAVRLGRHGLLHPDPVVREVVRSWATFQRGWVLGTVGVILVAGLSIVTWGLLLGVPVAWLAFPLVFVAVTLVNAVILVRRTIRTALDPMSAVATPAERQRVDRRGEFRAGWFARIAAMVLGFPIGLICAVGGFGAALSDGGNPLAASIVGTIGLGMLAAAAQALRLHLRAWRGGTKRR